MKNNGALERIFSYYDSPSANSEVGKKFEKGNKLKKERKLYERESEECIFKSEKFSSYSYS